MIPTIMQMVSNNESCRRGSIPPSIRPNQSPVNYQQQKSEFKNQDSFSYSFSYSNSYSYSCSFSFSLLRAFVPPCLRVSNHPLTPSPCHPVTSTPPTASTPPHTPSPPANPPPPPATSPPPPPTPSAPPPDRKSVVY